MCSRPFSRASICRAWPGRLALALAGAGLALTAAVAFATFVKVFGIGLLGGGAQIGRGAAAAHHGARWGCSAPAVLALAVGMPVWLSALDGGRRRAVRRQRAAADA